LVEQYQSILPQMKKGVAKERNESLEVSLRFSLDRLGADALNWLTRLWIFEGGAMENALLAITEIPAETWNVLKPQLTSTALIRVEEIPGVSDPFIHFHPTLTPYLSTLPESQTDYELRITKYWQVYYAIARQLYDLDTQHPFETRAIVLRELPNLKRALKRTLAAGALDEAVGFADHLNSFLDYFGRWRERDEIAAEVERAVHSNQLTPSNIEGSLVNSDGKITQAQFMMEYRCGDRLFQQGRVDEAEKVFRALLARLEGGADCDTYFEQTMSLRYIGLSLSAQGHPSQASDYYRCAIALAEGLEQTDNLQKIIAVVHTDLADALIDSGKYAESRAEYEIGLELARKVNDERLQGVVLGQLGEVAMTRNDLNEAHQRYREALDFFQRMGEVEKEAVAWHQLGRVAEEARDWDEAERCYKQALTIREFIQELPELAKTCNQLGMVAKSAGRPQEAEQWLRRAIELKEKHSTPSDFASSLNNLAFLYLSQNRLDEAEDYARRALAIKETLDLSSEPWKTYGILAQLAEKREHMDEVREWRRKEQESFAAFAGSDTQIKQFEPLIASIVQAANGDEKTKAYLEGEYPKMQAGGGVWIQVAQAIQRILAGERDVNILTDGIDREEALIIRRVLQALNGEGSDPHPPAPSPIAKERAIGEGGQAQQQGVTLPQLLELVERAAGGDQKTGRQLFPAMQKMASDPNAPREMQLLGKALAAIIIGDKNPNLDGLPDELASAVRGLLGRLKNK